MTTTTPDTRPAVAGRERAGRIVVASLVGTTIEFYDFYAYATAAVLVFPTIFFPSQSATAAQLSSFGTFALAFLARPFGSVVFGHFGDRVGRKATLVACLLMMGVATFLIGVLPPFSVLGIAAPVLLSVLRCVQGIGLGGEWSGAALLATENAPPGRRALWGMVPQLGAPIGFVLSNGLLLILSLALAPATFITWGWRIPFLLSGVLVMVGLYVRLRVAETPAFRRAIESGSRSRAPVGRVFVVSWRSVLTGTFALVATYVIFYFMTTFTLTYGTAPAGPVASRQGLGFPRSEFLIMLIVGVAIFGLLTPVSGWLADRWGRRRLLVVVTVAIGLFGLTFQAWLGHGADRPVLTLAFLVVGLALMGMTWGPLGALLPELFPTNVRYTGSAIAYNVGGVIGASFAPIVAVLLWRPGGDIFWVGVYLTGAAVVTLLALLAMPETRSVDLIGAASSSADERSAGSAGSAPPHRVLCGTVRDQTGVTVPFARLTLLDRRGRQVGVTASDAAGSYAITPTIADPAHLLCQAADHQPAMVPLSPGCASVGLDLVLHAHAAPSTGSTFGRRARAVDGDREASGEPSRKSNERYERETGREQRRDEHDVPRSWVNRARRR